MDKLKDVVMIRDSKLKLNFDMHYDVVSERLGKTLYKECKAYLKEVHGGTLPSRRVNFTLGDDGFIYTVKFIRPGAKAGIRSDSGGKQTIIERKALSWTTIPSISKAKRRLERRLGTTFTCCVIQLYPNGRCGIEPHKDREISNSGANNVMIAGLSLGATRVLTLTPPKFLNRDNISFELPDRSMYVIHSPTNGY